MNQPTIDMYLWLALGFYLLLVNIVAFAMYGLDKKKAKRGAWRITEAALLSVALIGGSVGALGGMLCFRHKTQHWKFKILVPLFLIIHLGIAIGTAYYLLYNDYWLVLN